MAWIEKMNRAKAYMEDDWRAADSESVYSVSDDDDTLPGDDADDCFSDDASSLWSYPHPRRDADPVQLSLPFRLGRDEDPAKPVYEGWVIHVPPDEEDATEGCRVLGMKTAQKYRRMPGTPSALFTTHTQEELAAMHLEALDSYHGSRRSSGGCLPLRRLVRRHTSRKTYDDDVDARIRKLSGAVQLEISNLLQDRGRCCSTATRKREFTVAVVREQLHHRFASVEPTAARRHRLRWWKDNTRGSELQYFVVIVGRQTQHEPAGLPAYTRLTNPWRDVDRQQAVLERNKKRIEREKAGFFAPTIHTRRRSFAPPYLRRRAPLAHEPERSREPIRVRIHSRSRERSRSRSRDPPRWTARDRSRSPYRERSRSPYSDRSRSPSRERHGARFHMGPPPSRCYAGPAPPLFGQPSYVPYPHRPGPPLHPPGLPMHLRYPYPARPPVFAPTMMAPPPAPPPQPHPSAFFPTSYVPPSTSWPPSPHSYRHSPPTSSYGPPPPLMNPLSALTTPSSLGSFRVPMFGPIPPPPPPPPPRSASDKASRPGSPTGASSPDFGENAFNARSFAKPPPRPYVEDGDESENEEDDDDDEEQDTLVGLTPIVEEMVDDVSGCRLELKCPEATARDAAKLLAKDKPGMHDDD